MAGDVPRSRQARAIAESTLAVLLDAFGPHRHDVVVIGGLTPDVLVDRPAAPHLGTTDVDLLVEVGVVFERDELDLGWVEAGLRATGFVPTRADGWRWRSSSGSGVVVVELLCDVSDNRGLPVALPGCEIASAINLEGPAPALSDSRVIELAQTGTSVAPITARFAALGGYLISKAGAVVGRGLAKDYYDFMFVTLYNEGGPTAAGTAAARAVPVVLTGDHRGNVRATLRAFASEDGDGVRHFVEQMTISGAEDDAELLAQDAIGAAMEFGNAFEAAT